MCLYRVVKVLLVILITNKSRSEAYKHKGVLQDDDVFSKCQNQGQNVLDVHGLVDLSDFNITANFYKITISGNATLVWDIYPTDRIEAEIKLLKFDRGSWQPTVYSIYTSNFCPIMYDKNQYWYQSILKYITNSEEVKDKCLNVPGTKFIYQQFDLEFEADLPMSTSGYHKLEVRLSAFDPRNKKRPTSICIGIRLEVNRIL